MQGEPNHAEQADTKLADPVGVSSLLGKAIRTKVLSRASV